MSKVFYLSEILKFAVEKEQQSADLYQKLADQASDAKNKDIFEGLVRDELGHKTFYADILSSVPEKSSPGVQEGKEYTAYMRQLIKSSRTTQPLPDDISSMLLNDILDYAIEREKDSVMFYLGLKQYVPENAKSKVDEIIEEESKHAAIIASLKTS